jgi:NADPH-ferrihemoprotein reductase
VITHKQAELEGYVASGVLSNLHLAFSREGTSKDYVQHHIEKRGEALWTLLSQGAYLYVCGDAKHMAREVQKALVQVVRVQKPCTGTKAEALVKEFTDAGRIQRDVW